MNVKEILEKLNAENSSQLKMIDLGRALWPDSETSTQRINVSNLIHGKTKSFRAEWVPIICGLLECDANELFNIKPKN